MSMIGNLRMLPPDHVERLLINPELISEYLYGPEGEGVPAPDADSLDIDKSWHVLHFLLTGSAWEGEPPLNFLVTGGTDVGDVDVGYGPARVFTAAEVRDVHAAFAGITEEYLRARFDVDAMAKAEIYPHGWDRVGEEDVTGYFFGYFEELQRFLARAAEEGKALVVFLN